MKPHARRDKLVVEKVGDETLVYDLVRHKAHCLNGTAAQVWRLCDGRRTLRDIEQKLRRDVDAHVDANVVDLALHDLQMAHLLDPLPTVNRPRRELLRRLGLAAALIPAVLSITAPKALEAAGSCGAVGNGLNHSSKNCPCADDTDCQLPCGCGPQGKCIAGC